MPRSSAAGPRPSQCQIARQRRVRLPDIRRKKAPAGDVLPGLCLIEEGSGGRVRSEADLAAQVGLDVGGQHIALHQIVEVPETGLGTLFHDLLGAGRADAPQRVEFVRGGRVDVDELADSGGRGSGRACCCRGCCRGCCGCGGLGRGRACRCRGCCGCSGLGRGRAGRGSRCRWLRCCRTGRSRRGRSRRCRSRGSRSRGSGGWGGRGLPGRSGWRGRLCGLGKHRAGCHHQGSGSGEKAGLRHLQIPQGMRPVVKQTHARRRAGTDVFTGNRQLAKPMLDWI